MMIRPGTPRSQSAIGTMSLSFQVRATANGGLAPTVPERQLQPTRPRRPAGCHLTAGKAAFRPPETRKSVETA